MTRSDLINRLAELHPQLLAKDVVLSVSTILDSMSEALSRGRRVEIRGFGSFCLNHRPPRNGRNPKTGEKVQVPAKYVRSGRTTVIESFSRSYNLGTWQTVLIVAVCFVLGIRREFWFVALTSGSLAAGVEALANSMIFNVTYTFGYALLSAIC
jgi:integration host factor subunit beta